jgi:hypothetical protein
MVKRKFWPLQLAVTLPDLLIPQLKKGGGGGLNLQLFYNLLPSATHMIGGY